MTDDPRTAGEIAGSLPTYVEWRERAETAAAERDAWMELAGARLGQLEDEREKNRRLRDALRETSNALDSLIGGLRSSSLTVQEQHALTMLERASGVLYDAEAQRSDWGLRYSEQWQSRLPVGPRTVGGHDA